MAHPFAHGPARRQRGLTFFGLIFIGSLIGMLGVGAAQVVPSLLEYQAIQKAVNKAHDSTSVVEARTVFERAAAIDNIESVKAKDLEIVTDGERRVIRFAYDKQVHLAGPVYLLIKYSGHSQ